MLKNNSSRYLRWLLVVLWMAVIFWASAQDATASSSLSGGLIEKIAPIIKPSFNQMNPLEQAAMIEQFQHIVRKIAHLSEYGILGILISFALETHSIARINKVFIALGISLLYAISDEMHQIFVPGRSGQLSDVVIDFCGAMIGVVIICFGLVCNQRRGSFFI